MYDLINSAFNFTTGGEPPTSYDVIIDARDDLELLAKWGAVHRRRFRWQRGWGDWREVYSAKHPTAEAANSQAREMALLAGYTEPRWWQFWRLGEIPLPTAEEA